MSNGTTPDPAGELLHRGQWGETYAALAAADADTSLDAAGLEQLAVAAYLTGRDHQCRNALTRAHQWWVGEGEIDPAVRCAFWIGMNLLLHGQLAPARGWFGRGEQLVADRPDETVGAGYLAAAAGLQALVAGDPSRALEESERATRIGRHAGEIDLTTLGHLLRGQALVAVGRSADGVAALDEAMVAVTAGEASPIVIGIVYCAVIEACQELCDLRRAQEWTDALGEWCDRQSGLVPYRGQCMVHRAELLRTHGSWAAALAEAEQAAAWLSDPPHPAVGAALYQQAELHRLRGDFEAAERYYRQASESGHAVQPGFALLRLAQGRVDDAGAAVRRALVEPQLPPVRALLLAARAEVALAADDVAGARAAADELAALVGELGAPQLLDGISCHVGGAVLLAEGDAPAALRALRQAWTIWHELDAPYEAARTRVQIALACRVLGDEESALLELDAARRVFAELGAELDGARTERLVARQPTGTLSPRELEVLVLVATGATNRAIAGELVISEKTVARHLSNIFTKLGVASRAAATAYAYEHDLVGGARHT